MKTLTPVQLAASRREQADRANPPVEAEVRAILAAQDARGRWVEPGGLRYHRPRDPAERGIRCETFTRNVKILSRYLAATRD